MNSRQFVLRETGMLAIGEVLCAGITVGVFAMTGNYDTPVLLGALFSCLMAVVNFFLMAVAADAAADRALNGDVKAGNALVKTSRNMRMLVLFVLILVLAKTGVCNAISLVVPLVLARPILMVVEFFRKDGEQKK